MANEKVEIKKADIEISLLANKNVIRWAGIVAGEVVVIMILLFLVVIPQWETAAQLREQYRQQQELANNLASKSEELDRFKADFLPKLATLDQAMPKSKDVGLMLSSLREIADKSGASIVEYKLEPGQVSGLTSKTVGEQSLEIELRVTGGTEAVQKFLKLIDASLPIKKIENLEVTSRSLQSVAGEQIQLPEVRILLLEYYLTDTSKAEAKVALSALDDEDQQILSQIGKYEKVAEVRPVSTESGTLGNENFFGL